MEYCGWKELELTEEELSSLYSEQLFPITSSYKFKQNEYLIAKNNAKEIIDYFKYNKGFFERVKYPIIKSDYMGEVKPRNPQQVLAIDLLQNPNITIKLLGGTYGTGKDYLMLSQAVAAIQKNQFKKIVYIRNNFGVENSKDVGYLPGNQIEKMLPWAMPLADILGGVNALESAIEEEIVEVQPLYYLRGRSFKDSIVYVSEGENLTCKNCQLIIGRIGEGSELWMNGDCRQADSSVFRADSGLEAMVNKLSGNELFGYVKLIKSERSKTAALCDLLD